MHIARLIDRNGSLHEQALRLVHDPDHPFPVLSAKFKLTWQCNLACTMCNIWRSARRGLGVPGLDPDRVRQALTDLHGQGLKKVHFSGGEVLMYPHFREVVDQARSLGLQVNLTTNGTLITKELVRFFIERRVHTVTVSLDGPDSRLHDRIRGVKGAFKAALNGIALLKARRARKGRGPRLAVNTVVSRETIDRLDDMHRLLLSLEADAWRILPVDTEDPDLRPTRDQWGRMFERIPDWQPLLSRPPLDWSSERSGVRAEDGKYAGVFYGSRICYAPWFNLFVDADGKIYPCCTGKRDMKPYANLHARTIEEALASAERREIAYTMASGKPFPVCDCCDDFLEENQAFHALTHPEEHS
jgi:MoaA/NifB/PqqE/SkfB family radical SAM enzyme